MKRRIVYIAVSLLLMIPLVGSYASDSLISGCPSSITAGSSASFTVSLGSDEAQDLSLSISPAASSLSVSGASADSISGSGCSISSGNLEGVSSLSFTATFSEAGTYTISAKYGESSDSCNITVTEAESTDDETDDDETVDDETNTDENQQKKNGKPAGGNMKSGSSGASGTAASGSASTSSDSKTTYAGSADNYLKKLKVSGYDFTQKFNKTNNTYFVEAESGVSNVEVKATPTDSDATVVITGTDSLSTGRNKVMVNVTAENGDVRVYRIYVDVK